MRTIFFLTFCLLSFFATPSSVHANPERTELTPETTELKTKDANQVPQVFYGAIGLHAPVAMACVRTTPDGAANLEDGAVAKVNAVTRESGATPVAAVRILLMDVTERKEARSLVPTPRDWTLSDRVELLQWESLLQAWVALCQGFRVFTGLTTGINCIWDRSSGKVIRPLAASSSDIMPQPLSSHPPASGPGVSSLGGRPQLHPGPTRHAW
ncbi:hypothetical protein CTheo_8196 [Ceratobasidium theobromae]|uniref:Effector protein n=1 Tax=Ceratobasidium theobromae TaxID=1582974 RepID=A0A5N5Q9M6_9AGAM|nr:hypothetical protein CTheo_8196 [Ceratobasidium theobromae]